VSAAAATPCPVCAEPLTGRPERCFRCETPLGAWWGFEDALGEGPVAPAASVPPRNPQRVAFFSVLAASVALAGGVVAFWQAAPEAPEAARPVVIPSAPAPRPSPAGVASPPPVPSHVVRYRVQRGDSLWRVAAALTGDGRRWKELFPGRADVDAPLVVGTVLEIDLGR